MNIIIYVDIIVEDSKGNIRIDSFFGDVTNQRNMTEEA